MSVLGTAANKLTQTTVGRLLNKMPGYGAENEFSALAKSITLPRALQGVVRRDPIFEPLIRKLLVERTRQSVQGQPRHRLGELISPFGPPGISSDPLVRETENLLVVAEASRNIKVATIMKRIDLAVTKPLGGGGSAADKELASAMIGNTLPRTKGVQQAMTTRKHMLQQMAAETEDS